MESKRLEVKVGLFVLIGLILMAMLIIWFSKGTSVFRGTYTLKLSAANVGGLKERAAVQLSGVIVGAVSHIQLMPDGKSVTIYLKIYNNITIYGDARFVIETAGFLGDQFVAIIPTDNQKPPLVNGATVDCEPPFDLQLVARSAAGFVQRTDETVRKIEDTVSNLQVKVLNNRTMTNLAVTVENLRSASAELNGSISNVQVLVAVNGEQVNLAMSNVVYFSQQLNGLADNAQGIIASNGVVISSAVTNLQDTTETLKQIADDMHEGKGLAGTILENEQLAANVQTTVNNLAMVSSNLNTLGLWHILWSHPPPRTNSSRK